MIINMASTFESSFYASTNKLPTGSSMADTLPNVKFGFDDLRERMTRFTIKFDAFIEQGRKRVLEERNQFRMNMAELQENERARYKDIEAAQNRVEAHKAAIAKEAAEKREMHDAVALLTQQRDRQAAQRDQLRQQIADVQRDIDARVSAQRAHALRLDKQRRFDVPELDFWVSHLGLRIEGAGADDRLKFVFTHVDERNWEREAWFELYTGEREYDVKKTRPKLDRVAVEKVLDKVNESRELVVLLKEMRELFVEAMKG